MTLSPKTSSESTTAPGSTNFVPSSVVKVTRWSNVLYSLHIKLPQPLSFIPGQYTKLAAEIKGELIARPYSIASAPDEDLLEFFLVLVDDGPLSHHLYALTPGDEILVETRAYGFLILEETPQVENMWLLATGTGIAPFLSMLREGSIFIRHKRVVLAQSVRYAGDLAYAEELAALRQRQQNFYYVPLVSRGQATDSILAGRITQALENGALEAKTQLQFSIERSHLMLCGNPQMVEDTMTLLKERGMRRHRRRASGQVTLEKFW